MAKIAEISALLDKLLILSNLSIFDKTLITMELPVQQVFERFHVHGFQYRDQAKLALLSLFR